MINLIMVFLGICEESESPPYYKCTGCPQGFFGNGTNCRDIDEVSRIIKIIVTL